MYYNTPFSLFPPNAAISLTDDNSTSFAARPAAFGPKLAPKGLSGQLWVGSGFADDTLDGDGELGCSDLPGWDGADSRKSLKNSLKAASAPRVTSSNRKSTHPKRSDGDMLIDRDNRAAIAKSKSEANSFRDDGTDNYLNEGLTGSGPRRETSGSSSPHADIQSIQEAAEIEGKVVLLMRGGCGFLEKVMWAQRRGAIAVIVGDNQKGGPLIQMFAHGEDVDNVAIPSVFTARTTAHLLSSLTQPGSFIEDTLDDNGNPVLKVQQGAKPRQHNKKQTPTSTRTTTPPKISSASAKTKRAAVSKERKTSSQQATRGWFSGIFSWGRSSRAVGDNKSRPPSSGRLDWILVEDWNEEGDKVIRDTMDKSNKGSKSLDDDFVIGVHDWRDPDLVSKKDDQKINSNAAGSTRDSGKSSNVKTGLRGGRAAPGSGEYGVSKAYLKGVKDSPGATTGTKSSHRLISKIFGSSADQDAEHEEQAEAEDIEGDDPVGPGEPDFGRHEGLWVTITPTSSASPFFDTLLVLVISPLVTLTVVYALLILRARLRRRRWRAPKSVVERLPVRTYHTVAASPAPSTRLPSPSSTSPTTPLLQQGPCPPQPQIPQRPRSRTTTGVLESENFLTPSSARPAPSSGPASGTREHEKGASGLSAEWRKYMGRQVECVVCLEEYVDGVSRVMSLPCGHEFHADCM